MKFFKIDCLPYLIPALSTLVFYLLFENIIEFLIANKIGMNVIYNGVFNIAAILTGFLFTIYCFIVVSNNPFLDRIQNTETFKSIKCFVLRTTIISLFSSLYSLILSSIDINYYPASSYIKIVLCAWIFITLSNFSYFFHCLLHFMLISDNIPQSRIRGG